MSFSLGGEIKREVMITFTGKDNASAAMRSIAGSARKTTSTAQKLGLALKYVGIAAATALAAGAALAAKALFDATKAAYYDDIAMKKLAFTQRKAQDATKAQTDATADLIDRLELATGIADDEMRPAMAALASTGMEVKESHDLLNLALDVSVARGKSVQTVAEALAKAYNGNTSGLGRLGIAVKDANGELLPMSEIMKTLHQRFDGAAKAAGKTDPLKRLSAAYNQLKEEVGAQLLPMLRKFSNWIIKTAVPWIKGHLVPAVKRASEWLGDKLTQAADKIKKWWESGGREKWQEIWRAVQDVWGATKNLISKVARLSGNFQEGEQKGDGFANALDSATESIETITAAAQPFLDLLNFVVDAFAWLEQHVPAITESLKNALNPLSGLKTIWETRPSWLGGGSAAGGWLPRAQGGWLVGEHGPEMISPSGFVKTHSQTMGAGGGPQVVFTGPVYGDPAAFGRYVERALAKHRRGSGRGGLT